jgi:uncharacterized membrane protein
MPTDDPLFPLLLLLRYMHILGAIALMGGTIFMRFALAPAAATLNDSAKADLHEQVRGRWAKFVMLAAALLLISGIVNLGLASRYEYGKVPYLPLPYSAVGGIKFILALPIFLFASFLTGRSALAQKFQANRVTWLNVNLALALVMVLMGGLLKFVPRQPKKAAEPVSSVLVAPGGQIASHMLPFKPRGE